MTDLLWLWILLGVIAVLAIIAVIVVASARKTVRAQQERVDAAWSAIVGHVAARGLLLGELEAKVGAVAAQERAALAEVAEARAELDTATDAGVASTAEDRVQGGLRRLLQVTEGYPELQRDQDFLRLQGELARAGGEIQTSRRHFNGAVREYNTKVRTLPGSLVAKGMGAEPREFFEVTDRAAIAAPPKVQF